jgi:hypothetical protein
VVDPTANLNRLMESFGRQVALDRVQRAHQLFDGLLSVRMAEAVGASLPAAWDRPGGDPSWSAVSLTDAGKLAIGNSRVPVLANPVCRFAENVTGTHCLVLGVAGRLDDRPDSRNITNLRELREQARKHLTRQEGSFVGPIQALGSEFMLGATGYNLGQDNEVVLLTLLPPGEEDPTPLSLDRLREEVAHYASSLQGDHQVALGDFLKTIRSIAKRIHLLALNASILSAQAGEHGRGFAVVAKEIGELAERTRQSTTELEAQLTGDDGEADAGPKSGGISL